MHHLVAHVLISDSIAAPRGSLLPILSFERGGALDFTNVAVIVRLPDGDQLRLEMTAIEILDKAAAKKIREDRRRVVNRSAASWRGPGAR